MREESADAESRLPDSASPASAPVAQVLNIEPADLRWKGQPLGAVVEGPPDSVEGRQVDYETRTGGRSLRARIALAHSPRISQERLSEAAPVSGGSLKSWLRPFGREARMLPCPLLKCLSVVEPLLDPATGSIQGRAVSQHLALERHTSRHPGRPEPAPQACQFRTPMLKVRFRPHRLSRCDRLVLSETSGPARYSSRASCTPGRSPQGS